MKKLMKKSLLAGLAVAVGLCFILPQEGAAQGWSCFGNGSGVFKCKVGETAVKVHDSGQHACFSADGKLIFFNVGNQIWSVDNQGNNAQNLGTHSTGSGATFCAYRPEPQTVLVMDGNSFYKINAATKDRTLVFNGGKGLYGEIAISKDGKRFAARGSDNNLHKGTISGTSISWSQYAGNCSASISPNGEKMTENGGNHRDMDVFNWDGGRTVMNNSLGNTWDNQRFSVNSDDWISVLFDNSVGSNRGSSVGAHRVSTNTTVMVGNVPGGSTQYPDFFFGDLPDPGSNVEPTCTDGLHNGEEEGVDCGGPDCPPCPVEPTCSDGLMNGDETGIDCGGPDCPPCGAPIYTEKEGYIVIEAESFGDEFGDWKIHDESTINNRNFDGYTGNGYIGFYGNSEPTGGVKDIISYNIKITNGGRYNMVGRTYEAPFETGRDDAANDAYIAMPGTDGFTCASDLTKWVTLGSDWEWSWRAISECAGQHNFMDVYYDLDPGDYKFQVAGRSKHFFLDRFVFFKDISEDEAKDLSLTMDPTPIIYQAAVTAEQPSFTVVSDPATSQISFRFQSSAAGIGFTIYNTEGKAVRYLMAQDGPLFWDKTDENGNRVRPGVYSGVLSEDGQRVSQSFVIF